MKQNIKIISFIFLLIIISLILEIIYHFDKKKEQENEMVKKLDCIPNFTFKTLNNEMFIINSIKSNFIVFNFFSPTCEHCQYMATSYLKNKEHLKEITIIMVTIADSSTVAKFNTDYHLNTMPNIIILRDAKFEFYKIFGNATVPSFFIYNHQKLVKKIIGETKIENLIAPFNSPEIRK